MIYRPLDFNAIYGQFSDYTNWKDKAREGTEDLRKWYDKNPPGTRLPKDLFNSKIYGELKESLIQFFAGKCAYCESYFESVSWGDVEHYRPKRAVTEDPKHRGYYWLAYWEPNLLPSCQKCNQAGGKLNCFPVTGKRALLPGDDLDAETPLLLNPYVEADCGECGQYRVVYSTEEITGPANIHKRITPHFRFVFEATDEELAATGLIEGGTERGRTSVEVYDLNRGGLVKTRAKSQREALNALGRAHASYNAFRKTLRTYMVAEQEHALAVRTACYAYLDFHEYQLALTRKAA
ncbi:MAG: hypothetical protein WBY44_29830 [Bryobacteraceae bacterium]